MIRTLFALMLFASAAWSVCTKINTPTDYAVVTNGTRANLKANFTEIQVRSNPCMDSVDEVRARLSGYSGSLAITSLENLRLRLDGDASAAAKFILENSNGDSLFRVSEDSTAKFFGALSGTTAAFSGAISSVSPSFTGTIAATNGTFSGTLGVTGTSTLAAANLSGDANVSYGSSGGTAQTMVKNTSNTASSDARFRVDVQGTSAGDPYIMWVVNGGSIWSAGIDNSSGGDPWVLAASGTLGTSNALSIATSGAATFNSTVTADSIISPKFYDEGTFTIAATGMVTACSQGTYTSNTCTGTASWVRVGKKVTLNVPNLIGTSGTTGLTLTGVPSGIRPSVAQNTAFTSIYDNSIEYLGALQVGTGGTILVFFKTTYTGASGTTFTAANSKGLPAFTFTYIR